MRPGVEQILILSANVLLGAAILVFAVGFFPHKAVLPGLATWQTIDEQPKAAPPFDKVIFMVVDALRSDFVYSNASKFHFTQNLIRTGAAVPFTGHASPPTITMPRVKAITTGSVPSFIDLVLNFAESDTTSTLALQDSWLAQMKAKAGAKLVMFGDDTWLRLFPGFFERSDGTTSFFVSDFTEVDHNVTRNVPDELQRDDWSAMVLHYLGLDHIGHKTGPQGPNMPAKQAEMDGIVKLIYNAMENNIHLQNTVLILLGDHGMNEAGNHGASSSGETSTALTFISPKFRNTFEGSPCPIENFTDFKYYDVVAQSDIAATLAALLGFPIPKNSLGIIIPRLLNLWSNEKDRFDMLYTNAQQVKAIAEATFTDAFSDHSTTACSHSDMLSEESALACMWQNLIHLRQNVHKGENDAVLALKEVNNFLTSAQSLLSGAASKYDLDKMSIGIGLTISAFCLSLLLTSTQLFRGGIAGIAGIAYSSVLIIYAVTMFASSYVEEEHQFWYWSTAGWLICLAINTRRSSEITTNKSFIGNLLVCLLFGIARRWNQTGQKYAGGPDLVTMVLTRNRWVLWASIFATYAFISRRLTRKAATWGSKQIAILPMLVAVSAFFFKIAFTAADAPELLQNFRIFDPVIAFITQYPLAVTARIVFLGLGLLLATAFFNETPWKGHPNKQRFLEVFHDVLSLFLITQTRTVNIPLFLIFYIQAGILQRFQNLGGLGLTLTSILMQYSSFFIFGGTNAISSIDLSNAYNGISGYNILAVGILTFVSNWAGSIWWTSATSCLLRNPETTGSNLSVQGTSSQFSLSTLFATGSTLAVMVACMALREHLFIWTVFSPKYLYVIAWVFGQHFIINGLFGTIILGNR